MPYKHNKLLSLIIGARNDTFMGNFRWRLGTTLNFIGASLERAGGLDAVEVVVCDWGSRTPLHQVLDLTASARRVTRFVLVPPAMAQALQHDSPFPIPIVQNIAIRRSRGAYIAQTDSDVLFTAAAMGRLLKILRREVDIGVDPDQALLVASRRHIPFELTLCQPDRQELCEYLHRFGAMLPAERLIPGIGTPSALALMHKSLWKRLGGYDERLIYWGWMEIDLYLRATQRHPWQDVANEGVILYHMEHYPSNDRSGQPRKANPTRIPETFCVNDRLWGLADTDLEISRAGGTAESADSLVNSSRWRCRALGDMPPQQIAAVVSDQEIAWQVDRVQQIIDPRAAHKYRFSQQQRAQAGWGYREALAWYAQQMHPLRYLEIGAGASDACLHVAAQFPAVSIFALWTRLPGTRQWPLDTPNRLSDLLIDVRHNGYVRHLFVLEPDDVATSLEENFDRPGFDLIFVHPIAVSVFRQGGPRALLPYLRDGGAIVWPEDNPQRQHAVQTQTCLALTGAAVLLILKGDAAWPDFSEALRGYFKDLVRRHRRAAANQPVAADFARLQDNNNSAPHHFHQGLLFFEQGNHRDALNHFKQAVCLQPHCFEYRKSLGQFYLAALHNPAQALIQFQRAHHLRPHDPEPLSMMERIYRAVGQTDIAERCAAALTTITPKPQQHDPKPTRQPHPA